MTPKEEFESKPLSFIQFNEAFCALAATIDVFTVGDLFAQVGPLTELLKQQNDREIILHYIDTMNRLIHILTTANYSLN